jgi:polysaccharide deacetylase family protein (PEP-CTERM system associated)
VGKDKYLTITVDVEEWFHSNWFDSDDIIKTYYDGKIPHSDVVDSVDRIISMFDDLQVQGTFFILGGTAERYPSIMDAIKDAGHEIASHGYYHDLNTIDTDIFREDIQKFKKNVYAHPKGFRFPNYIFQQDVLDVLSEEGFLYDSSVVPSHNIPGWYGDPQAPREPHYHQVGNNHGIMEFPISVLPYLRLPGAGGWFLRNMGFLWTYYVITVLLQSVGYANIYFHNWEISSYKPKDAGIPFHVFRNTGKPMIKRINYLIKLWKNMDSVIIKPFEELLDAEINKTR